MILNTNKNLDLYRKINKLYNTIIPTHLKYKFAWVGVTNILNATDIKRNYLLIYEFRYTKILY